MNNKNVFLIVFAVFVVSVLVVIFFNFFGQQSATLKPTTTVAPTTTTVSPTTTTPEPTTTTVAPTTTASMDLSSGIASMDTSQGIASMNLFQTFGTTTPPPTQKPILDAIKSSLTLKNDGNGTNYTLNGVYDGKDVELVDKNHISDYSSNKLDKYVYETNEIVEFTFTNTDINQDYKIKLRILSSSLEFDANLNSSVKFTATTAVEIPVAPSVYTSLKLTDGIINSFLNEFRSQTWVINGTYDGKNVTLSDKKNIAEFSYNFDTGKTIYYDYIYKINEIVEFSFTNPVSKQESKVNLKITKINVNVNENYDFIRTFNAILSPPITENYEYIGVY